MFHGVVQKITLAQFFCDAVYMLRSCLSADKLLFSFHFSIVIICLCHVYAYLLTYLLDVILVLWCRHQDARTWQTVRCSQKTQSLSIGLSVDLFPLISRVQSNHAGGGDQGCGRPELRLHVQAVDHRQQQRREDVVPVPLLRRLLLVVLCQHSRHWLQSQDRVPTGQTHQATDLGIT